MKMSILDSRKILREHTISILFKYLFIPKWKCSHHLLLSFLTCGTSLSHKRWILESYPGCTFQHNESEWELDLSRCKVTKSINKTIINVLHMTLFYYITSLLNLFDKCWSILLTRLWCSSYMECKFIWYLCSDGRFNSECSFR